MAKRRYASVLIGILAVALVAGFWRGRSDPATEVTAGQETETPTPGTPTPEPTPTSSTDGAVVASPIFTEIDAVARSIDRLPSPFGESVINRVARLVSGDTIDDYWFDGDMVSRNDDDAYWLVGLRTEGLTVEALFPMPDGIYSGTPRPIDGAFYVWEAGSGEMISSGGLSSDVLHNYSRIQLLTAEPVPIVTTTPILPQE
jgi:hypothetical protein